MAENQDELEKYGQPEQRRREESSPIQLLTIIGEVEGHECLAANSKTTKYEHVIPMLAAVEENPQIQGLLVLINTVGGDVESGLAIAEMIASISKPSVSLGSGRQSFDWCSVGGVHGLLLYCTDRNDDDSSGPDEWSDHRVAQTFEYFQKIQDRIAGFITDHSRISKARLMQLMLETGELTKDVGSVLVGEQAVSEGLIDELGGIHDAYDKLYKMLDLTETK